MKRNRRFAGASLDKFRELTAEHKRLIDYLKYCLKTDFSNNIFISGGVGTGKTYLAYSIIESLSQIRKFNNEEYYSSDKVFYIGMAQYFDLVKSSFTDRELYPVHVRNAALLILDDVENKIFPEWEKNELFRLADYRYKNCLSTIIISNSNKSELTKAMGVRIADRLFYHAEIFTLITESGRKW